MNNYYTIINGNNEFAGRYYPSIWEKYLGISSLYERCKWKLNTDYYFNCFCKYNKIEERWEEEKNKKDKEFVEETIKKNPVWFKERKIEYIKSELENVVSQIFSYNLPDFLMECLWELKLKQLIKKKKRLEFQLKAWQEPSLPDRYNKITQEDIERAKEIPIKNLLGEPKKKGREKVFYSSPFRSDSDPSFCVYLKTNTFFDFGNQESGDVIKLYQQLYDVSFLDAVRELLKT